MGMFAADLRAFDPENEKIALRGERDLLFELSSGKAAPKVRYDREFLERHSLDLGGFQLFVQDGVRVADDLRRISRHDCIFLN